MKSMQLFRENECEYYKLKAVILNRYLDGNLKV